MARYIDADLEVSKYVTVWDCDCSEFGKQTVMAVDDLHYLPTADVAPRAEVAREIFEEIDKFLKEKHQAVDDIWCDIEDDDEVLNAFYMAKTESYFVVKNFVDELKKKYTEETP